MGMGWLRWQSEAVRESYFGAKWFKHRPEVCDNPSHRKEFFRKVYDLSDNSRSRPTFCSKRCEREFYSFLKNQKKLAHDEKKPAIQRYRCKKEPRV